MKITIKKYQMEDMLDMLDILLNNNYVVKISSENEDTITIEIVSKNIN